MITNQVLGYTFSIFHVCTDSFAAEECYTDVVQQAKVAVEANGLGEELVNGNTAAATTEASCTLTVSDYKQH